MSTPKPGQIRCPTCHESTPPAAFCTRCGQPIPASARTRPRGMDREELEERLRGRRPGDAPYRRGAPVGEGRVTGFDRFEPEPEDALAVREAPTAGAPATRVDNLSAPASEQPTRRWPRQAPHRVEATHGVDAPHGAETPYAPPVPEPEAQAPYEPPPAYEPDRQDEAERYVAPEPDDGYDPYDDYDQYPAASPYDRDYRGNGGPWLIVGIIALGLVALLGGVLLSGLLSGGPGVARSTATPTLAAATPTPSVAQETATPAATSEASEGPPGTFPDGFTASVQPCGSTEMKPQGCVVDGTTLTGDTVWVWAGFTKGTGADVVGVTLVDPETKEEIQDASLELSQVNCAEICNGYLKFSFSGLSPGDYALRVSRNGTFAAEAPFTVGG